MPACVRLCSGTSQSCTVVVDFCILNILPASHDLASLCRCVVIFVMHWQHTLDIDWLRDIGYPYLREVAAFWSCYLVKDEHGA